MQIREPDDPEDAAVPRSPPGPLALSQRPASRSAVPAIAQSANALAPVQSHLAVDQSMTADFTQTDRNGQRAAGTLTLKRPGRIRFEYQKGVPLLIVGDGRR